MDSIRSAPARPALIPLRDVPGLLQQLGDTIDATSDRDLAGLRAWIAVKLGIASMAIESHLTPPSADVEADPAEWPCWVDNWHWSAEPTAAG